MIDRHTLKTFFTTFLLMFFSSFASANCQVRCFQGWCRECCPGAPCINFPQNSEPSLLQLTAEARVILQKHNVWQSLVLQSLVPGGEPSMAVGHPQKWKLNKDKLALIEILKTSTRGDCTKWNAAIAKITNPQPEHYKELQGIFSWVEGKISLHQDFLPSTFLQDPTLKCSQAIGAAKKINIKILKGDRLLLSWNDNPNYVVFFPSKEVRSFSCSGISPENVTKTNLWTAPLGSSRSLYEPFLPAIFQTDFLRNDLTETRIAYYEKNFPAQFVPTLEKIIAEWNGAFGKNYFFLRKAKENLTTVDCLSSNYYCFFWPGASEVAWTGFAAGADISYDPQTGFIQSAIVTIHPSSSENLKPTPKEYEKWFDEKHSIKEMATLFMKQKEFANYRHPRPEVLIYRTLNHEMGHANGFGHNFAGSLYYSETLGYKNGTIMEYLPFPAYGPDTLHLQNLDYSLLEIVYKGTSKVPENFLYCNDQSSQDLMSLISLGYFPRKSYCQFNDLGDPAEWYLELGRHGEKGVFSDVPLNIPTRNVLYFLGRFLVDANESPLTQRRAKRVTQYLCSLKSEQLNIHAQLQKDYGLVLYCSE